MKTLYPILLLLFVGFTAQAQTFVIEEDSTSATVDVEEVYNADFTYDIAYNDTTVATYRWTLELDAPSEWQSQICLNPVKCYPYDTDKAELEFEANIDYEFALKVFHNEVCGEGDYILRLETTDGVILEEVKSHVVATNCAITNTVDVDLMDIQITPNPAQDQFVLSNNDQIQHVMIFNSTGSMIKTFGQQNSYSVHDLASGLYFVRILDKNNQSQSTSLIVE